MGYSLLRKMWKPTGKLFGCRFGIPLDRSSTGKRILRFRAIMKTFYKGASAVLLTYDISSEKSFQDLDDWYKQISICLSMQRITVRVRLS